MLDLTCVPSDVMGLIGSAYFIGFAISATITPLLADHFGRRIPYNISLMIAACAYMVVVFISREVYLTIGCYVIVGLCASG